MLPASHVSDPDTMLEYAERLMALASAGSLVSDRLSWWWLLRWAEVTAVEE